MISGRSSSDIESYDPVLSSLTCVTLPKHTLLSSMNNFEPAFIETDFTGPLLRDDRLKPPPAGGVQVSHSPGSSGGQLGKVQQHAVNSPPAYQHPAARREQQGLDAQPATMDSKAFAPSPRIASPNSAPVPVPVQSNGASSFGIGSGGLKSQQFVLSSPTSPRVFRPQSKSITGFASLTDVQSQSIVARPLYLGPAQISGYGAATEPAFVSITPTAISAICSPTMQVLPSSAASFGQGLLGSTRFSSSSTSTPLLTGGAVHLPTIVGPSGSHAFHVRSVTKAATSGSVPHYRSIQPKPMTTTASCRPMLANIQPKPTTTTVTSQPTSANDPGKHSSVHAARSAAFAVISKHNLPVSSRVGMHSGSGIRGLSVIKSDPSSQTVLNVPRVSSITTQSSLFVHRSGGGGNLAGVYQSPGEPLNLCNTFSNQNAAIYTNCDEVLDCSKKSTAVCDAAGRGGNLLMSSSGPLSAVSGQQLSVPHDLTMATNKANGAKGTSEVLNRSNNFRKGSLDAGDIVKVENKSDVQKANDIKTSNANKIHSLFRAKEAVAVESDFKRNKNGDTARSNETKTSSETAKNSEDRMKASGIASES